VREVRQPLLGLLVCLRPPCAATDRPGVSGRLRDAFGEKCGQTILRDHPIVFARPVPTAGGTSSP
jgi:hypothetical protein